MNTISASVLRVKGSKSKENGERESLSVGDGHAPLGDCCNVSLTQ